MRCEAVLPGGAETEPPKTLGQLSCVEAGGGQGGVALLQERGKAPSDCCIVLRCEVSREVGRKGSQKVVGARGGAEAQQQPRCLEVVDGGDARQEPVMVVALMPELARDERITCPKGEPSAVRPCDSGGRVQSPTQTLSSPSPRSAMSGGSSPAAFQIRVLPWCRRIRARSHNADARAS